MGAEVTLVEVEQELRRLGCSDGYCCISPRHEGMHTNGGCHCARRLYEFNDRSDGHHKSNLVRHILHLKDKRADLMAIQAEMQCQTRVE